MPTSPAVLRIPVQGTTQPYFDVPLNFGDLGAWSDVSLLALPANKVSVLESHGLKATSDDVAATIASLGSAGTCLAEVLRLGGVSTLGVEILSRGTLLLALQQLELPHLPVIALNASVAWLVTNCGATSAPSNWQVVQG